MPNIQDLKYDQDFDFEKNAVFCRPMIIDKLVFLVLIIVLDMITIALWHKGWHFKKKLSENVQLWKLISQPIFI